MLLNDFFSITDLKASDDSIQATVEINDAHKIFEGHFPGNPIVPGVCMVQMTKEIMSQVVNNDLQLDNANNIKFLSVINPNQNKTLHFDMSFSEENGNLKVQNRIYFEDKNFFKFKGTFQRV